MTFTQNIFRVSRHLVSRFLTYGRFLAPALILLALMLSLPSCSKEDSNPAESGNLSGVQWTAQNTVVCYGTSITFGYGAGWRKWPYKPSNSGDRDSSYPSFLQDRLQIKVLNLGSPGAKTRDGLKNADSVHKYNPVLILLEYASNDYLSGIKADSAEKNMNRMVEIFQSRGYKVALLSFVNPDMISKTPPDHYLQSQKVLAGEYYEMLKRVAQKYRLPFVDYIYRDIWYNPGLFSDQIHPNGKGYSIMAGNIFSGLYPLFNNSRMLK